MSEEKKKQAPRVPDYELLRQLGEGRFGSVWLGRSRISVHYAIKIVPRGRVEEIERLGLRSSEVVAQRHPSLVEIRHVGETDGALYYVMELADGYDTAPTFSADDYVPRTLEEDLKRKGALDLEEAAAIALAVADGLEHLHRRGLLHRDVKPANIVFVGGRPKLADVGLLTPADTRDTQAGTPSYMPPETVVDASGDVYCLGKTLFEMVTGASAAAFPELPADLAPEQAEAYRRLSRIIDQACAPDRKERFQSARAFRQALHEVLGRGRAPAPSTGHARARRTGPWMWASAAAVLLSAALVVGLFLANRSEVAARMQVAAGGPGAAGQHGTPGPAGATAAAPPLEGKLRLKYQPPQATSSSVVDERNPRVPLEVDGELWFEFELSEPAYAVVAYVDPDGTEPPNRASPGQWSILYPKDEEAQQATAWYQSGKFPLEAPADPQTAETMTFVLLASREPASDLEGIRKRLGELGAVPRCAPGMLLHLGPDGRPGTVQALDETTRGIDPKKERDHPPGDTEPGMLAGLPRAFDERFPVVRALAVPLVARD